MKCENCKKKISKYAKRCPYCSSNVGNKASREKEYNEYIASMTEEEKRPPRVNKLRCIAAVACAMTAVLLCVPRILGGGDGQEIDRGLIYYVQNNTLLVKSLESGKQKVLSNKVSNSLNDVEAGKVEAGVYFEDREKNRIYYASNIYERPMLSYDIYSQSTKDLKEESIQIGKNVRSFLRDRKGGLYYVTTDTACLYHYDGENTRELPIPFVEQLLYEEQTDRLIVITKASSTIHVNSDQTYSQSLDEEWYKSYGDQDVFLVDCKGLKITKKMEQYKESLLVSSKHDRMYYLKNNQLYEWDVAQDKTEKVMTGVAAFTLTKQDELYYIAYELQDKSYYDFVKDPYAAGDKKDGTSKQAKRRNAVRKQLKDERIFVFSGCLHRWKDGLDTVIDDNAAVLTRNSVSQERIRYSRCKEQVVIGELDGKDPEKALEQVEEYLHRPIATNGKERLSFYNLYNYSDPSVAIPEQEKAYVFAEENIYEYDNVKCNVVYCG